MTTDTPEEFADLTIENMVPAPKPKKKKIDPEKLAAAAEKTGFLPADLQNPHKAGPDIDRASHRLQAAVTQATHDKMHVERMKFGLRQSRQATWNDFLTEVINIYIKHQETGQ